MPGRSGTQAPHRGGGRPSKGRFVQVPTGAVLYVERSGHGPPVVLIHGNFVSLRMWDRQLPLADSFDLIRYDVRGFGRSPLGSGRYSDEADLAGLLDVLDLDSAHLVGSSNGGLDRVGHRAALREPCSVACRRARRHQRLGAAGLDDGWLG